MKTTLTKRIETALVVVVAGTLLSLVASTAPAHAHDSAPKSKPFIDNFSTVTQGDTSAPTAGPEAGDQNPYGVAVVPRSVGKLIQGNILVSNFNNVGAPPTGNLQGTGTSIVQYSPDVQTQTTFAEIDASTLPGACPGGVGRAADRMGDRRQSADVRWNDRHGRRGMSHRSRRERQTGRDFFGRRHQWSVGYGRQRRWIYLTT